nr:JAB domain-containing protein [Salsipaludibacter albus]
MTTIVTHQQDHVGQDAWRQGARGGVAQAEPRCPACVAATARAVDAAAGERLAVTSPESAATVVAPVLAGRDREACVAVALDTRHLVLDVGVVSIGSLDHTFMAPREVYRDALLVNAAAVVVAHNHPSGDPTPSADDVAVTTRLARAGEVVGVDLLDHLVVAGSRWQSLARQGHC